ncbi:MAG: methyltransferase domain-containing protein [bacterium]|nr:methyltransferase domain-containing protein [bacterium]
MKFEEYKKLAQMEEYYWWHVGRKYIIEDQLKMVGFPKDSKILNMGCGTGGTVNMLSRFGQVVNVDTSDDALKFSKNRGISNLVKVENIDLPFQDSIFDIVVGLDVIEHIKDDEAALREWFRVLRRGGVIFLTAPAYQWLWSEHDESLHHYRRYSLKNLINLVPDHAIIKKSYAITFTLPLIVGYRLLKKIAPNKKIKTSYVILPSFLNSILIWFLRLEVKVLHYINFPFGTSILLILRKK